MPDGHGAPGDGGRPGGGARPTRLVLRRARAQAGLVAMVTALVVAGATVLGLCSLLLTTVRDQALVAAVRGTDPASVQVVAAVTLADDATAADAAARALAEVSDTTQTALAAFPTTTSVWATSTRLLLDPAPDGGLRQTYLLDGDDVAAHATLTAGRWPTSGAAAVTEVALPDSAARLLGVASGSTISLTGAPQHAGEPPADPRTVLVVGTFTPRRGDQAWTRDPLDAAGYATYALGAALPAYGPLVVAPGELPGHRRVEQRPDHALLDRDVDVLARPGGQRLVVGDQRRRGTLGPAVRVGDLRRDGQRRPVRVARDVGVRAHRLQSDVGGGVVAVGAVRAVRGDRRVHQPGVRGAQHVVAEAAGGHPAQPVGLDEDVGLRDERQQPLPPVGPVQRQADAALADVLRRPRDAAPDAVRAGVPRRAQPRRLPARRLDLHDVGPQLGEHPAGVCPGLVGEVEDPQARERSGFLVWHRRSVRLAHVTATCCPGNRSAGSTRP
ncbi:MAG: hypothetical protein J0I40_07425, partial [Cellulomonas sp.]|nr:hypothetical protein [Cellulomonas sp.]